MLLPAALLGHLVGLINGPLCLALMESAALLLVLLALWLWYRIPRQGPRQEAREESSRDYLQHLHASGYFQWRTEQQDTLLTALRQQALALSLIHI